MTTTRFDAAIQKLREELGGGDPIFALIEKLNAEAWAFGTPRTDSAEPALRLLAFDGLLTEFLSDRTRGAAGPEFDELYQALEQEAAA